VESRTNSPPKRKLPLPLRIIFARPRLFLSILAGFAVGALLPLSELRGVTRFLVGWDTGVGIYLALAFWMIGHSDVIQIKRQSLTQDEGGFAILVLTTISALASVGAVFAWLEAATRAETFGPLGLGFLMLTILISWAFIHTMFALHYAHEFYAEHGTGKGLIFPGDAEPTYWDFVYFAFAIGTASQVSDVEVSAKRIRRTVTVHGIVAFFFNVTVIALTVGLAGNAIQH
jgi:uncharacterized membrane protein